MNTNLFTFGFRVITTTLTLLILSSFLNSANLPTVQAQELIVQNFDAVNGWRNLQMGMSIDDAAQVLHQDNIDFKDSRKTITKPGPLYFSFSQNSSDITVYFDEKRFQINQILLITENLSQSETQEVVKEMQTQYGKAQKVKPGYSDQTRQDTDYIWNNQFTKLTLTTTHDLPGDRWTVFTCYSLPDS